MNKAERRERILQMLREGKDVSVCALSAQMNVSEVTIRKDLQQLEREGCVRRSYGKVALPDAHGEASAAPEPGQDEDSGKRRIGALAAEFVRDEDLIFIGPGQTCASLARSLRDRKRLSVITMNVSAAMELAGAPEFKLLLAPGDFTRRGGAYYVTGPVTARYAEELFVDKLFITADGVDIARGFTVLDEITAQIYRALIKPGTKVYVCVSGDKFSRNARAALGALDFADAVITDARPSGEFMRRFAEERVEVYYPTDD